MQDKNYLEAVKYIESVCLQHPFVNSVLYNVYFLSDTDNIEYPTICITPNSQTIGINTVLHSFNLMYVDRLTKNRTNELEIHSVGIDTIRGILNVLDDVITYAGVEEETSMNVFSQQFADDTAGVISTINIVLPSTIGECSWYKPCNECE